MPRTSLQTVETLTTTLPPFRLLALRGSLLASPYIDRTYTREHTYVSIPAHVYSKYTVFFDCKVHVCVRV